MCDLTFENPTFGIDFLEVVLSQEVAKILTLKNVLL